MRMCSSITSAAVRSVVCMLSVCFQLLTAGRVNLKRQSMEPGNR